MAQNFLVLSKPMRNWPTCFPFFLSQKSPGIRPLPPDPDASFQRERAPASGLRRPHPSPTAPARPTPASPPGPPRELTRDGGGGRHRGAGPRGRGCALRHAAMRLDRKVKADGGLVAGLACVQTNGAGGDKAERICTEKKKKREKNRRTVQTFHCFILVNIKLEKTISSESKKPQLKLF